MVSVGSVLVKLSNGVIKTLENVRHVPDLQRNLIFHSTLYEQGYVCKIRNGIMKISEGALIVTLGIKMHGLYILSKNIIVHDYASIVTDMHDSISLWHDSISLVKKIFSFCTNRCCFKKMSWVSQSFIITMF